MAFLVWMAVVGGDIGSVEAGSGRSVETVVDVGTGDLCPRGGAADRVAVCVYDDLGWSVGSAVDLRVADIVVVEVGDPDRCWFFRPKMFDLGQGGGDIG